MGSKGLKQVDSKGIKPSRNAQSVNQSCKKGKKKVALQIFTCPGHLKTVVILLFLSLIHI